MDILLEDHHTYSCQVASKAVVRKPLSKKERKILKIFLLTHLYRLFYEILFEYEKHQPQYHLMEAYAMDKNIIQAIINEIINTGEYTLEGIAYYTRIPFDVIYDAACGIQLQLSITVWARIFSLYIQVKPDIGEILVNQLLKLKDKNISRLSTLLMEA